LLELFDYISIAVMVILLGLSAFFSATETAYSTFNRIRMKKLAQDGNRRAQHVLHAAENYDKMLTTVLIGNNIVNLSMSSLSTLFFIKIMGGDSGAAVSTAVITVMVLIFGEISPKNIAKEHADGWVMAVNPILRLLMFVFTPFTALFSLWKKLLDILFHKKNEAAITDEELKTIVDEAEEDGGIDPDEGKLIRSAIEFNDVTVNEILTPRVDICALEVNATQDEITDIFMNSSFSRLPVYETDLDHIIGVLHEKDFYTAVRNSKKLEQTYKKPVYVSEHTKISDLLNTFKTEQCHMAIVVDEFGGTKGLVTMEDIIEELIGDVFDEHDEIIEEYTQLEDGSYHVLSTANLSDFFEKFEIEVRDDENLPQTVNGWVMLMLESLPDVGATFVYENLHIEVTRISEKRVEEVHVTILEPSEEEDENSKEKSAK